QEYILLSDTLGASTLVDSINHPMVEGATATTVFGPFYVPAPDYADGDDISPTLAGTPMYISGRVRTPDGSAVSGATVDIWHSDGEGFYDVQQLEKTGGLTARGRFRSDGDGGFQAWTKRP